MWNTEQEWQFAAAELESARAWLALPPAERSGWRLAVKPTLELTDTYYDTADWAIFRAGFALRLRREREGAREHTEITLKSLTAPRDGLARRTEISQRFDDADMNAVLARVDGIGGRIRELIGGRELMPLFEARTRRERRHLLEAGSESALAEVALDQTSIGTPSGASRHLTRVEVECLDTTPEALLPFVEKLREAARLVPVRQSKFRAGLDAAGLRPPGEPAGFSPL
jgi:triphosphatase